jgi:hypothetical protein
MGLVFPGPRAVECHNFDVVITDLGMPYIDARQVAAAVKDALPGTGVILLTGWGQRLVAEGEVTEETGTFSPPEPGRASLWGRWREARRCGTRPGR